MERGREPDRKRENKKKKRDGKIIVKTNCQFANARKCFLSNETA